MDVIFGGERRQRLDVEGHLLAVNGHDPCVLQHQPERFLVPVSFEAKKQGDVPELISTHVLHPPEFQTPLPSFHRDPLRNLIMASSSLTATSLILVDLRVQISVKEQHRIVQIREVILNRDVMQPGHDAVLIPFRMDRRLKDE